MSRYRRLKIEGGAFFSTRALADRGNARWSLLKSSFHAAFRPRIRGPSAK
jgi:hypothetical protein